MADAGLPHYPKLAPGTQTRRLRRARRARWQRAGISVRTRLYSVGPQDSDQSATLVQSWSMSASLLENPRRETTLDDARFSGTMCATTCFTWSLEVAIWMR